MSITARAGILTAVSAAVLAMACSEGQRSAPTAPTAHPEAPGAATGPPAQPGAQGAGSERRLYQVRLSAEANSRAVGVMLLEVANGYLTAKVQAAGLEPGQHIPQHIHLNPTCNPGGGILFNLDAGLTVAGEGPGVGAAFPVANQAGVVDYEARRSLADLRTAANTYLGAGAGTVDELLTFLALEDRNGHMHVAFGPPFPAVTCGEVVRVH
jgi:hypothetical protein